MAKKRGECSMSILNIIKSRRIIKKFKQDRINRQQILSWLQVATMAPNHRMTEPWEFIFVGPQTRANLNHKTNFGNAPVVFTVLSNHGKSVLETEENRSATSCLIQNFMLAAWEAGVGTFWSSIAASAKNRALLNVPDGFDVIGVLAVGYPEEIPEAKQRTPIDHKISELP